MANVIQGNKVTSFFLGTFLFLLGLILCVMSYFFYQSSVNYLEDGLSGRGVVTAMKERVTKSTHKTLYNPVVTFTDNNGEKITFVSKRASSFPGLEIGDEVDVLYMADNSRNARINSFSESWLAVIISGLGGAISLLAGFKMISLLFKVIK